MYRYIYIYVYVYVYEYIYIYIYMYSLFGASETGARESPIRPLPRARESGPPAADLYRLYIYIYIYIYI